MLKPSGFNLIVKADSVRIADREKWIRFYSNKCEVATFSQENVIAVIEEV
jgi:hypothetical protein